MQNSPINVNVDHDYDSSSLRVAYMLEIMQQNMPHVCTAYFGKFHIFFHVATQIILLILRKFSTINWHP